MVTSYGKAKKTSPYVNKSKKGLLKLLPGSSERPHGLGVLSKDDAPPRKETKRLGHVGSMGRLYRFYFPTTCTIMY